MRSGSSSGASRGARPMTPGPLRLCAGSSAPALSLTEMPMHLGLSSVTRHELRTKGIDNNRREIRPTLQDPP